MSPDERDSDATAKDNVALLCPHCEYNLTGLPENRCPECGEAFDPVLVRRRSSHDVLPATPWDTERNFRGFWKTWWMALASPRRLAEQFPARHDSACATVYSYRCYGLAVILFWGSALGTASVLFERHEVLDPFRWLFVLTLGGLITFWNCEMALALVLALLVRPKMACRRYHFWRGLTHYTSGFTLVTGWVGGVVAISTWLSFRMSNSLVIMITGAWTIVAGMVFVPWVIALNAMICSRSHPGWSRAVACALVPVVGLAMVRVGLWTVFRLREMMEFWAW